MKTLIQTFLLLVCALGLKAQPAHLRCEYLVNPIGVDAPQPRLSWLLNDDREGALQKAYQIIVGADSAAVLAGRGDMWDSQSTPSATMLVNYAGKPLQASSKYFWKVNCVDKDNVQKSSTVSSFETGLMGIQQWQGTWISDGQSIDYRPAPYFRKEFAVGKKIQSARAYIAAAGLYELYLNGEKVGNHRLDPMYTRFDRRTLYVTYDVTHQLKNGPNAVGVVLGNGWYNHQSIAVWDFHRAPWRNRPAFCLDLRIVYTDGSVETIVSERDWKTSSGAVISNSIYTAEQVDNRLEQDGWNRAGFNDSAWRHVRYRAAPSQNVVSQQMHPIRNVEELLPQSVKKLNDTTYLFDFGRNISGVTKMKIAGQAGTRIRLKHVERLLPSGFGDMSNIDVYYRPVDASDPFQSDLLILKGKGTEEFMPRFNYKGFRYVEVSTSTPIALEAKNLTAYFMHSDVPQRGSIESSSDLINKLSKAANSSYLSNLMGYPTDCPQREKNGWTGDGHLAIEAAFYNYDGITIYEKWLNDHLDEQQPNGVLPDIIPTGGWGYGTANGVDWTSTIAIIPWNVYLFYGDSQLLRTCYPNIRRYVNYITRNSPDGLTAWGRGDWVPVKTTSSLELTSSVYYYADVCILAQAAKLFDQQADYVYYTSLAQKIKSAINAKYLNAETGIYANGSQTELSVPLFWGVTPDELRVKVASNLAEKVKQAGFHLDVGVLGAKAILNALSENGQTETAYRIATQNTYPSWGWWIVNGATTLLENWDLKAPRDISDNHMMFGEIGAWFYKGLGGIKPNVAQPGFKHIELRPYFPADLTQFKASHQSPYGAIVSEWVRKKKQITYTVQIPANTSASLYLPGSKDATPIELKAGKHTFQVK